MRATKNQARLNVRLSADLKRAIEEAAAELGQTVSNFAVSTLAQSARKVLLEQRATVLSRRERELFMRLIDDPGAKPNRALAAAARRYKTQLD